MRTIIFIFLSVFSIANGQIKKNNIATKDNNLKVPENYSRLLPKEPIYGICGNDGAVLVENAENYEYNFYKKDNHVYFEGKLTTINANGFQRISYSYYKNKSNVYYYKTSELQKIEGIDANSAHLTDDFLADRNGLYYKCTGIIKGQNFEFVSNSLYFQDVIIKNTTDGLKGKVYATFIVEKNGILSGIKILRDIGYGTGEEYLRVLMLCPKWKPAIKNGQNVRCTYSLPLTVDCSVQKKINTVND